MDRFIIPTNGKNTSPKIAYFSMEVGLNDKIPTYSGGLGILAGDTLKSAADNKLKVVGVTLLYNNGYFNQDIDRNGLQSERYTHFDPRKVGMIELSERVQVHIKDREVSVRAWLYKIKGSGGYEVPLLFLDTNGVNGDRPWPTDGSQGASGVVRTWADDITSYLYGGDQEYRIAQEIVLGLGGVKMLQKLGYDIETYHMNEGHAAFLTLELLMQHGYNPDKVKEKCVFTTHTPVPAGHDAFSYHNIDKMLDEQHRKDMWKYAGQDRANMTLLAMNLSRYVNAVSRKHADTSRQMFPGYHIDYITNGVHPFTWTSAEMQKIYDMFVSEWRDDPERLINFPETPETLKALIEAQKKAKAILFDYVSQATKVELDPDLLTIGFARRATPYKRSDLIFSDIERLKKLGSGKIQFILAGKAHPQDSPGKDLIYRINAGLSEISRDIKGTYVPDYDMRIGALITSGVDLWLNSPQRPLEASGTSGMKAALNGIPSLSIVDGWWCEGLNEGVTGWAIGNEFDPNEDRQDANALYEKLERIINLNGADFNKAKIGAIIHNASHFNTNRMIREYAEKAWLIDVPKKALATDMPRRNVLEELVIPS